MKPEQTSNPKLARADYSDATPEEREERETALKALGLSIVSTFVPFSQSRNAESREDGKAWRSLNWKVTLSQAGRAVLKTDYAQGEAHAPAYKNPPKLANGRPDTYYQGRIIEWECEHGKVGRMMPSLDYISAVKPIPGPSLLEVCYSLALDAQAGSQSFEDFCSNFGYDSDSRKAHKTWKACANAYEALGPKLAQDISTICEGY